MKNLLLFLAIVLTFACVEKEEEVILAYEYDPERLCLINPDAPFLIDTREVVEERPFIGYTTCSVDETRRLVIFQAYFDKEFVECDEEVWGDLVYRNQRAGPHDVSDLKCPDE